MIVSCDIETLGLGLDAPIIQIGAVLFDPVKAPGSFDSEIEFLVAHEVYNNVEPYAAAMNADIMAALGEYGPEYEGPITEADEAADVIKQWLEFEVTVDLDKKLTFTGKNFASFDLPRLRRLPNWDIKVHHRVLDPGSLYYRPDVDGDTLPDTKTCMERAGISGEVAHTAVEDAKQVAKMIQVYYQ